MSGFLGLGILLGHPRTWVQLMVEGTSLGAFLNFGSTSYLQDDLQTIYRKKWSFKYLHLAKHRLTHNFDESYP